VSGVEKCTAPGRGPPARILLLAVAVFLATTAAAWGAGTTAGDARVALPAPKLDSPVSVEQALRERRSVRRFLEQPLTLAEVGQLLWAAQGITGRGGLRTTPSAGALYPLEAYLVAGNVTGLPTGVYKYDPHRHRLLRVASGDRRAALRGAALGQDCVARAPAVLVLAALPERTTRKYGQRGHRYVHMEAGHAAQNVYLQAFSLNLGTVAVGAFVDRAVKEIVALEDDAEPLYLLPVGRTE